jgi:hypothetical protein
MKANLFYLVLLILSMSLTACVGDVIDVPEEGFEFTDEEAAEALPELGFDFTDDEALAVDDEPGFVFDEDEVGDPPGMDFDDDEALNLSDLPDHVLPPNGKSNWLIMHDDGTATCPNQTITIWGNEPVNVTISLGAEAAGLLVSGLEGGPDILLFLEQSGPYGSIYNGYFQPPGANSEFKYRIVFSSMVDASMADYLDGSITGNEQGCYISRSFQGNRVD